MLSSRISSFRNAIATLWVLAILAFITFSEKVQMSQDLGDMERDYIAYVILTTDAKTANIELNPTDEALFLSYAGFLSENSKSQFLSLKIDELEIKPNLGQSGSLNRELYELGFLGIPPDFDIPFDVAGEIFLYSKAFEWENLGTLQEIEFCDSSIELPEFGEDLDFDNFKNLYLPLPIDVGDYKENLLFEHPTFYFGAIVGVKPLEAIEECLIFIDDRVWWGDPEEDLLAIEQFDAYFILDTSTASAKDLQSFIVSLARKWEIFPQDAKSAYLEMKAKYTGHKVSVPMINVSVSSDWALFILNILSLGLVTWGSFLLKEVNRLTAKESFPYPVGMIAADAVSQLPKAKGLEKLLGSFEVGVIVGFFLLGIFTPVFIVGLLYLLQFEFGINKDIFSENLFLGSLTAVVAGLSVLFIIGLLKNFLGILRQAQKGGVKKPKNTTV